MKICVVSPRYQLTGVAMAQLRLSRALAEHGHEVELIYGCLDYEHLLPHRRQLPVVPGVRVSELGRDKVRDMFKPMCRYLREQQPDVVFSAEDHLNDVVLLAALITGSRAKISGSSHVIPTDAVGHDGPYSTSVLSKKWIFKQITGALMRRADALTCVSEDMVKEYQKLFRNSPHVCVHNVVIDEPARQMMAEPAEHPWFSDEGPPLLVTAGTLTKRKGFTDLIRGIGHLRDRGRAVRLMILGDGPMRAELEGLARELRVEQSIWFAGRVENPFKYYAKAQVSVLSSYAEGLPMVLVEAMMCGCVPVATDCPTGPSEVLQDGRYGYLVPMHDPSAMADGIAKALDNPIATGVLAQGVRSFEGDAVVARHFEVLGLQGKQRAA